MDNTVYLNGEYLPLENAKVSVLDRGFLFGDGVYEVIPVYMGRMFRFREHLERLNRSLSNIRLELSRTEDEWRELLAPLLVDDRDQYIYLQITRGVAPTRDHAFPTQPQPTVFAMASELHHYAAKDSGVKAVTLEDSRWDLCHVKATTLLANILLRQQAVEHNCAEAVLYRDGYVTEGAASNIFAVLDGVLTTPANSDDILPGITRDVIIELAKTQQVPVTEAAIALTELRAADEIWFTSSTREIVPVVELDGKTIGNGQPGPLWEQMNAWFQQFKRHDD